MELGVGEAHIPACSSPVLDSSEEKKFCQTWEKQPERASLMCPRREESGLSPYTKMTLGLSSEKHHGVGTLPMRQTRVNQPSVSSLC